MHLCVLPTHLSCFDVGRVGDGSQPREVGGQTVGKGEGPFSWQPSLPACGLAVESEAVMSRSVQAPKRRH